MKIKFLGTAAAEGWPALFCDCEACMRALESGGRNIRTRSSCLIDDKWMFDFPPDTYVHVLNNRLALSRVEHLIVTHSHHDHFYPQDIQMRNEPYAHIQDKALLTVYGNKKVKMIFNRSNKEPVNPKRLIFQDVSPYIKFNAGEAEVTPLLADHTRGENCYLYLFELGEKVLLYGHDTGYFPEITWRSLNNVHIDAVLLDCTQGEGECNHYHMGFSAVVSVVERLVRQGCLNDSSVKVITHFSHNGRLLHDELTELAKPYNIIAAYDGMELDL